MDGYCSITIANHGLSRLHLVLHACVRTFDVMFLSVKFLKLNTALGVLIFPEIPCGRFFARFRFSGVRSIRVGTEQEIRSTNFMWNSIRMCSGGYSWPDEKGATPTNHAAVVGENV